MNKLIYAIGIAMCFTCCSKKETQIKKIENTMTPIMIEKRESYTPAQRSVIRKIFDLNNDTSVYNEVPYYSKEIFTPEEFDAQIELCAQKYNYRNLHISEETFRKRLKEVFGYDEVKRFPKELLWRDYSENTVIMSQPEDFENFWISNSSKTIMHDRIVDIKFSNMRDITTYIPKASLCDSSWANFTCYDDRWKISTIDLYYHWNNYIFNESKASRVWLLKNDIYFMTHLITNFGYDGDMELNKALLGDIIEGGNPSLYDQPFSVVHFYPEGRIKIMDGLLKTMEELSTAENTDYYYWATNELYRYAQTAEIGYNEVNDEEDGEYSAKEKEGQSFVNDLSFKQRCEIIAHITNYIYPVCLKFIEENSEYGDPRMHAMGIDIPPSFWNVIFRNHEILYEIDRNNCYGLPNLQQLLTTINSDPRFYNEEGKLAPWDFDFTE